MWNPRMEGSRWLVALGLMTLAFLKAEVGYAAVTQREPVPTFVCQLTIDGLEGNRSELKPGAMFIQSYSVEMVRPGSVVGPVQGFAMTVTLSIPQLSPLFMMAHASGVHFGQATLQCLTSALSASQQWVLSDVALSAYKVRLDIAPGVPTDQITLTATKAEFNDLVRQIKFSWDAKANQGGVVTPAGALQYLLPPLGKQLVPGGPTLPLR